MVAVERIAVWVGVVVVLSTAFLFGGGFVTLFSSPSDGTSYDHDVQITNEQTQSHELRIVVRAANGTNATVHDDRYEVAPGADVDVFSFESVAESGTEEFRVVSYHNGTTAETTITMDSCHGDVLVSVASDGSLQSTYSIC